MAPTNQCTHEPKIYPASICITYTSICTTSTCLLVSEVTWSDSSYCLLTSECPRMRIRERYVSRALTLRKPPRETEKTR